MCNCTACVHVPVCLLVPPSPITQETNRHFQPNLSKVQESGEETWFYASLASSQVVPKSAEGAASNGHITASQISCVFARMPLRGSSHLTVSSQI